ncbi:uncharacterized protein MONBRDRAFT_13211, partial [Monosiga brevicollis MX1]
MHCWAWKVSGNSSFEFGVIRDDEKNHPESLHVRGLTGFYSSSTCGSRLPRPIRVPSSGVVEVQCSIDTEQVVFLVNGRKQLQQPLNLRNWSIGEPIRLAITLWN